MVQMSITDNGRVVFWSDAVTGVVFQHACLLLEGTTTLPRLTLLWLWLGEYGKSFPTFLHCHTQRDERSKIGPEQMWLHSGSAAGETLAFLPKLELSFPK